MTRSHATGSGTDQSNTFQLVTVERCEPPADGAPGTWCRYTISQGDNVITGTCKGSSTAVTDTASQIVAALNARRTGGGRVHIVLKSEKSKPQ